MADTEQTHSHTEYEGYLSKATKEAGFTFFGKVFALVFGFAANVAIARLLGADLLGVYVLAWAVVMGVSILTTFGFEGAFVKYISMYVGQGKQAEARAVFTFGIRFGIVAGLLGTVAIVLLRRPIAHAFFKEPRLEQALLVIALAMLPFTLTRLQAAALRAMKDMKRSIVGAELWFRVPRLAIFLVLFYFGLRLGGVVVAAVAACVASAIATARFAKLRGPFLFGSGALVGIPKREISCYASQMLAETATAFTLLQSGRLVLGFFLTSADVGIYNVVVLLATLATLFRFSWNAIFSPIIADLYHRGGMLLMKSLLRTITRWTILMTLPVFAWLLLSGEGILSIFGEEFVQGYVALVVLAAAQLVDGAGAAASSCLAMTKYQRFNVYNILVMAVIGVALSLLLVPRMGILGASVATGISIVLVAVARLAEGRALLKVLPFDRSMIKVVATGAVLIGLACAARRFLAVPREWYWSAATLVACYGVAVGMTLSMGITDEDRMVWSSVLRKILRRS